MQVVGDRCSLLTLTSELLPQQNAEHVFVVRTGSVIETEYSGEECVGYSVICILICTIRKISSNNVPNHNQVIDHDFALCENVHHVTTVTSRATHKIDL